MSKIYTNNVEGEVKLVDCISNGLSFRDPKQQLSFEQFKCDQTNTSSVIGVVFLSAIFLLLSNVSIVKNYLSAFSIFNILFQFIFPTCLGVVIMYLRVSKERNKSFHTSNKHRAADWWLRFLESLWVIGCCISFNLGIILSAYNGPCPQHHTIAENQGCNREDTPHKMNEAKMILSLILPVIFAITIKNIKWSFVCASLIINTGMLLFTMLYFDLTQSFPVIIVFIPFCMLLMYENHRQNMSLFLLTQSQKNLIKENKRLAEEAHAVEMRHMIGNVAHDLKTVSLKLSL